MSDIPSNKVNNSTEEVTDQVIISDDNNTQISVIYANDDIEQLVESTAPTCLTALQILKSVAENTDTSDLFVMSSLKKFLLGTSGIDKVQKKALILLTRYETLVNCYNKCKEYSIDLIESFSDIRYDINTIFQKYINELQDVFGTEAVRSIAPTLFDFSNIQFIDVYSMLNQFNLEYDSLNASCSHIMDSVDDSFFSTVDNAFDIIGESTKKSLKSVSSVHNEEDLLGAGIDIVGNVIVSVSDICSSLIDHYSYAHELTSAMKLELEELKNSLIHDASNIQADAMRLFVIIKNLNDLFIPQANEFYIHAQKVMSEDLQEVINSAYSTEELRLLRDERKKLQEKYTDIDRMISEETNYLLKRHYSNSSLDYFKHEWKAAVLRRVFLHIFDLGSIALIIFFLVPKFLELDSILWKVVIGISGGLILLIRIWRNINWKNIWAPLWNLQKSVYKQTKITKKISMVNKEIRETINVDESIKTEVASHLKDLIKVLKVGRAVLENKIDNNLLKPVKFPKLQDISISSNASRVIKLLQKTSNITKDSISIIQTAVNEKHSKNLEEYTKAIQAQNTDIKPDELQVQKQDLVNRSNELHVQSQGVNVLNHAATLGKSTVSAVTEIITSGVELISKQKQGRMAAKEYNKALQDIKSQFKNQLNELDNQADVLNEALKKVHLAGSHDDLVQALSELTQGSGQEITKEDIEDMLAGKKTITI